MELLADWGEACQSVPDFEVDQHISWSPWWSWPCWVILQPKALTTLTNSDWRLTPILSKMRRK